MKSDAKKIILIIEPFDALTLLTGLEYLEENKTIARSLRASIAEYRAQIEDQITHGQIDDANAEFATRKLLDIY